VAILLAAAVFDANAQSVITNDVRDAIILDSGVEGGSGFQWFVAGTNGYVPLADTNRLSGSQGPVLTITNAALSDSGTYLLTALSNGSPVTVTFVVYVLAPPVIERLDFFIVGNVLTFQVQATGGLLFYQWSWQGIDIAGATNHALVFTNADLTASAGYYTVRVRNPRGETNAPPPGVLFTKPAPSGTYQGLFFDETMPALESSGWFQYTLSASKRSFSGKLTITNNVYTFSGAVTPAQDGLLTAQPKRGGSPVTLRLQLLTTNNNPQVIGTVSNEFWIASLRGNRLALDAPSPSPLAGRYTLAFQNTNLSQGAQSPSGNGYGIATVSQRAAVVMKGRAADGTAIAHACALSKTGAWPLYISLYKNRGCLIGWLSVNGASVGAIQGESVSWIKQPFHGKLYPGGFTNSLQPNGSTYTNNPKASVIPFTNAVAVFTGGDLFAANAFPILDFVHVSLPQTNRFVAEEGPENLKLSVNRGSGVITGHFTDLITGRTAPIQGVVLQQQRSVLGYFLSTNSAGYFGITPNP
jgi:hypothetical protein